MRALLVVSIALTFACSKRKDGGSLSERVEFSCGLLANELRQATDKYKEYAGWIETMRLSPEQQGRAEGKLPYGLTDRERVVATRGLFSQFLLCARSRELEEQAIEQLTNRAAEGTGDFITYTQPAEMARSIEALAALAAEIKNLPVRD